jgi:hypothetical protein
MRDDPKLRLIAEAPTFHSRPVGCWQFLRPKVTRGWDIQGKVILHPSAFILQATPFFLSHARNRFQPSSACSLR